VVPRHLDNRAVRSGWWHPERVFLALDDQHRHPYLVELGEPARGGWARGPAGRLERERQAEHRDGTRGLRGTAGHPAAERPTADDQRQPAQLVRDQVLDDRDPGGVELVHGRRGASPGDPVGLLHERDGQPFRPSDFRNRHEVWRSHTASRAMT
jgi:hypothetical protein